jgi:transcriptional regulator with XRE-family HTH domain
MNAIVGHVMPKKKLIITSEEIGKKIKKLRRDLRISQEAMAEALGVTYQQVQRYENGANKLNVENIQVIAQVLSVKTSFFFETEELPIMQDQRSTYLTSEENVLIRYFRKTSNKTARNTVIQVAKLSGKLQDKQ